MNNFKSNFKVIPSPLRTALATIFIIPLTFAIMVTGCDSNITNTDSSIDELKMAKSEHMAANNAVAKKTVPLIFNEDADFLLETDEPIVGPDGEVAEGRVTLNRTSKGALSWRFEASGLTPGHAYSIWLLNGESPHGDFAFYPNPGIGGYAAGGLVNARGNVRAAGNHCVADIQIVDDPDVGPRLSFGFEPGLNNPNDCDVIQSDGPVTFVILDKGPWTPGNMVQRRIADFVPMLWATFNVE